MSDEPDHGREGFTPIANSVAQDRTLSGFAKAVLLVIRSYDWGDGCTQTQSQIAEQAGWAVSTTKQAIAELEERGLLRVQRTKGQPSIYFVVTEPSRHTATPSRQEANQPIDLAATRPGVSRHTARDLAATRLQKNKTTEEDDKKKDSPAGAGAAPLVQTDTPRAAEQRSDTRALAESWMKANEVDPATVTGKTAAEYNAWAAAALKHRDRETLVRFLRWMWSKRRHEGVMFTITPTILDQRIGQWLSAGKPERYEPSAPRATPAKPERRDPLDRERSPAELAEDARIKAWYARQQAREAEQERAAGQAGQAGQRVPGAPA